MNGPRPVRNIIWSGSGRLGLPILERLLATKNFNISLLTRNPLSEYSFQPIITSQLTAIHHIDYASPACHSELVAHMKAAQADAVVVFSSFLPGNAYDTKHIALIDAAIAAGVSYFLPSEWALDTAGIMNESRGLAGPTLATNMVLAPKRVAHNYLLCRAAEGQIKSAAVFAGVLVERCMDSPMLGLNFSTKTADLADYGINPFPACTFTTLSKALEGLLQDSEKIRNRFYHVSDGVLTLNDCFRIVRVEDDNIWEKTGFSTKEAREMALHKMAEGVFGPREYLHSLSGAFFGGLQVFTKLDNEELGIKDGETVDLKEEVKRLVKERLQVSCKAPQL